MAVRSNLDELTGERGSGGPLSGPLDKSLGLEADPEGGKVYDKGSAWAGAANVSVAWVRLYILRTYANQAEAWSGSLDKSLGRKADPEGGKVYDKGSAWAGALNGKG